MHGFNPLFGEEGTRTVGGVSRGAAHTFQPPLRGRGDSDPWPTRRRRAPRSFNPLFGEEGTRTPRWIVSGTSASGCRFNPLFGEEGTRTHQDLVEMAKDIVE